MLKIVEIDAKKIIENKVILDELIEKCSKSGVLTTIRVINTDEFYKDNNKYIDILQTAIEKCMELEVGMVGDDGSDIMPDAVMKKMPDLSFDTDKLRIKEPRSSN